MRLALETGHIVVQLGTDDDAIAPVEIVLARLRVLEHVGVYRGAAVFHHGKLARGQRFAQGVLEGTCGVVADGYAYLVFANEVIVVFVAGLLALAHLALNDAGGPGLALSPLAVCGQVQYDAFVLPVFQVLRRIAAEVVVVPVFLSVGGGIEVVFPVTLRPQYFRVSIEALDDGVVPVGLHGGQFVAVAPGLQAVILFFGQSQEGAVLGGVDALNVAGLLEVAHVLVGHADAVVARLRRILYVAYHPVVVAGQLEGRDALALLVALKTDVVVLDGFSPRTCQLLGGGGEESGLAALFLDHHVPLLVCLHPVDVGIDGGVAPVKEQTGLGEPGESLVGITIVHAVILFLGAVPHRVVDEVAAALAVGPLVVGIPHHLRSPHAVDGGPVLVDALRLRVGEDADALPVVEGLGAPVNQVVTHQQVNAVVVPLGLLLQVLEAPHIHVGTHHQVARAVVLATDEGIAGGSLNAGHLVVAEDAVAIQQVVVVQSVAAQCIGCPGASLIVHVAIQVAVVATLQVSLLLGLRTAEGHTSHSQAEYQSFHHLSSFSSVQRYAKNLQASHFSDKKLAQMTDFDYFCHQFEISTTKKHTDHYEEFRLGKPVVRLHEDRLQRTLLLS